MGSGSILKRAFNKYGIENFKKEILKFFDSENEMYKYEENLVTEDLIKSGSAYNVKLGGLGGFDYLNSTGLNNSTKSKESMSEKARIIWQNRSEECKDKHRRLSGERMKELHRLGKIPYRKTIGSTGYKHSQESRKMMSESRKGSRNSQFGTKWIHKDSTNKKIHQTELQEYLDRGWSLGKYKVNKC